MYNFMYSKNCKVEWFSSLDDMREFAKDPNNDGDYYIAVPSTQSSAHYHRENILKKFDLSHNT